MSPFNGSAQQKQWFWTNSFPGPTLLKSFFLAKWLHIYDLVLIGVVDLAKTVMSQVESHQCKLWSAKLDSTEEIPL